MSATHLEIAEVRDVRSLREIALFPWQVYRGDKNWVPPLIKDRLKELDPTANPFFQTADVAVFVARRKVKLVGTIVAFVDHPFNEFTRQKLGQFGYFEVLDDEPAAHALLARARDWLRERGMDEMRGPINFHRDRERGILVSGADCPPPMLCAHSPPYYQGMVERFGMTKYADDLCRRLFASKVLEPDGSLPPRMARLRKVAERRSHLAIRPARMSDWDAEVQRVREVYDATIGDMPDHSPWTGHDLDRFARQLRPFVDPDFCLFAEVEGRTVGIVLAFPDMNQVLIHLNGRTDGLNKLLAWWYLRRVKVLSFKVGGVIEQYQGLGIEALFLLEVAQRAVAKGYEWVDLSLQAETNEKITTLVSHFDVEEYKRYRLYTLSLRSPENTTS